ncbi:hypothetical protein [Rubinisphaera margarita]|uniref:hypothetical protein n=1 Tax=Rubinisphaera margarita TaxID=2909586 RepID=UPI001EE863C4|nr:hypothetical protein [Rubinisphaera margarita]MCG6158294.1 hypothetical protein [Rubinisphaera margarita]
MFPDLTTWLAKFYLAVGTGICILFIFGASSGWKLPESSGSSAGRSGGGFWGVGK